MSRVRDSHVQHLLKAFDQDGYSVDESHIFDFEDKVGILAEHKEATNYDTGERKRAYYVEGSPYQMGYLMGLMAEPEIERMTTTFIDHVVWELLTGGKELRDGEAVEEHLAARLRGIHEVLVALLYELSAGVFKDVPQEYISELKGILDGCLAANRDTRVDWSELWVINVGLDCLLSLVYTGDFLLKRIPDLKAQELRLPIMCNGFAVFGDAAGGRHYFGRDLMFPNGDVFQDVACLVIYNPDSSCSSSLPIVSMTAPGFVGSVAAMNLHGVAAGVDMSPAANCDPKRPGLNSLLLVRRSVECGDNAETAVDVMVQAQRGVSWDYIIADGGADKACVVEAGYSTAHVPFLSYPPARLAGYLPDQGFLNANPSGPVRNGLMVRWADFDYPEIYVQTFNDGLWKKFNKTLYPDAFTEMGYIDRTPREHNCPESYYFAPQRETLSELVLVTNQFISPEMRLCGMDPWTTRVAKGALDDLQWRYDELNHRILSQLAEGGTITYGVARSLIDFLAPYGDFPDYYAHNPTSKDGKELSICGSTSLFDLKGKTVESHFGYFCDKWIKLDLTRYFE
jgi:hypothetical protein